MIKSDWISDAELEFEKLSWFLLCVNVVSSSSRVIDSTFCLDTGQAILFTAFKI